MEVLSSAVLGIAVNRIDQAIGKGYSKIILKNSGEKLSTTNKIIERCFYESLLAIMKKMLKNHEIPSEHDMLNKSEIKKIENKIRELKNNNTEKKELEFLKYRAHNVKEYSKHIVKVKKILLEFFDDNYPDDLIELLMCDLPDVLSAFFWNTVLGNDKVYSKIMLETALESNNTLNNIMESLLKINENSVIEYDNKVFYMPFTRNNLFYGRKNELNELNKICNSFRNHKMDSSNILLWGVGGIGKTQLITEYCYEKKDKYEIIGWFNAENKESLINDLIKFSYCISSEYEEFRGSDSQNSNEFISKLFSFVTNIEDTLLVFDNVVNIKCLW